MEESEKPDSSTSESVLIIFVNGNRVSRTIYHLVLVTTCIVQISCECYIVLDELLVTIPLCFYKKYGKVLGRCNASSAFFEGNWTKFCFVSYLKELC